MTGNKSDLEADEADSQLIFGGGNHERRKNAVLSDL